MNRDALHELAKNAAAFAKAYVEIKEALMREGVPQREAAESARVAALIASEYPVDEWP